MKIIIVEYESDFAAWATLEDVADVDLSESTESFIIATGKTFPEVCQRAREALDIASHNVTLLEVQREFRKA